MEEAIERIVAIDSRSFDDARDGSNGIRIVAMQLS